MGNPRERFGKPMMGQNIEKSKFSKEIRFSVKNNIDS
jgi:hypothetical protein